MELRHLRYFVAVAEEGSLSRAAKRLHISQPPLSAQIRDLEEEIGCDLFQRNPRGVELTATGQRLLDSARRMLREADDMKQLGISSKGVRSLRVGVGPVAHRFLPAILRMAKAANPPIDLEVMPMNQTQMAEALHAGMADAALLMPDMTGFGLGFETLHYENACVVVGRDHPLANQAEVRLRELADERWIMFSRELAPTIYDMFFHSCAASGFVPKVGLTLKSYEFRFPYVAAGIGVAIAPSSLKFQSLTDVVCLDLNPALKQPIGIAWHTRTEALDQLVSMTREVLGQVKSA